MFGQAGCVLSWRFPTRECYPILALNPLLLIFVTRHLCVLFSSLGHKLGQILFFRFRNGFRLRQNIKHRSEET